MDFHEDFERLACCDCGCFHSEAVQCVKGGWIVPPGESVTSRWLEAKFALPLHAQWFAHGITPRDRELLAGMGIKLD